jgi:hypothetical protein
MAQAMTNARLVELAAAAAVFGLGLWLYRRRKAADQGYGSQSAVLLFAIGAIVAIHALGGLDYHPNSAELERASAQ